jgi:predicted GTPase
MRRIVIMGAAGRDFHNFNVAFRDDLDTLVVAFTATQIPGIADRVYPAELAGPRYPSGIPVVGEDLLERLVMTGVDEVVHAYSDVSHLDVMHTASRVLAAGADFRILGPRSTMLHSRLPVVAVCAVRTGAGKSPTSRYVAGLLQAAGLRVALIRHPMPYGDLARMRVQRFATLADIDAADPTVEEREEYEAPVRMGVPVFAGVDYAAVLAAAEADADVLLWDGGNNDLPFIAPDVHITVVDSLRPGHETSYHPGETNLRMADAVVISKVDSATPDAVEQVTAAVRSVSPDAAVVLAAMPVTLEPGPDLSGRRALVIEDGPTITHGEMPHGAGTVAALAAGAQLIDPRPWAAGSLAEVFAAHPHIGAALPAMGYSSTQLAELEQTIRTVPADVVIVGTPADLGRLIDVPHAIRRATYELQEVGGTPLAEVLGPVLHRAAVRA